MVKRLILVTLAVIFAVGVISADETGSRRRRPGSMHHTEAEITNARKITKLTGRYIRDGRVFSGAVYMTGEAGAIKIGDAHIAFSNGGYKLSYTAGEFKMRKSSTRYDREREGISEYEYDHSWKNEKLGSDFDHAGKYEIAEQYGKVNLILYNGNDTDSVFAKIPLNSANDQSFEFYEDSFLLQFSPAK